VTKPLRPSLVSQPLATPLPLPVIAGGLPDQLTTLSAWTADTGLPSGTAHRWSKDSGFPAAVALLRGRPGVPPRVYRRADLEAFRGQRQPAGRQLPMLAGALPAGLTTLDAWAADIGFAPSTVRNWSHERAFPAAAAMHGRHRVYRRSELDQYRSLAGFPPGRPLPAGLTTLDAWAADIGFAPSTVRNWSHERAFPAAAGMRGRTKVFRGSDLEAYMRGQRVCLRANPDVSLPSGGRRRARRTISIPPHRCELTARDAWGTRSLRLRGAGPRSGSPCEAHG
jgi:hypothetical protein